MTQTFTFEENKQAHVKKGFTFIELVIAISILGILALIVGPGLFRYLGGAKISQTETNIKTIKSAVNSYYASVGQYPTKLDDLIRKPANVKLQKWIAPFLEAEEVPTDAWNNPFVYKLNAKGAARPYELYSFGPNGPGSAKDEWIDAWK